MAMIMTMRVEAVAIMATTIDHWKFGLVVENRRAHMSMRKWVQLVI